MNNILICGLGAIGSNMLVSLSKRHRDAAFTGIDYDKVEDRNVGPQQYFLEHIGQPKALAMNSILARFNRKFVYVPINKKLENKRDFDAVLSAKPYNLVLDCFDNVEARELTRGPSQVLHIGFSPQHTAEIIWDKGYSVPGEVDPNRSDICENPDAAAFIGFVANFASMVVGEYLDTGKQRNYVITGKYRIKEL